MPKKNHKIHTQRPVFIDLFSGCGGLSLGLINAGWQGLFAVERDRMAFSTLKANLIDGKVKGFKKWPEWLKKESMPISRLTGKHLKQLRSLSGKVDLIAGGPPCQGFSTAGKRDAHDPRNKLTAHYLKIVSVVKPRFLLLENVRGFDIPFGKTKAKAAKQSTQKKKKKKKQVSFAQRVAAKLQKLGYTVHSGMVHCDDYGVPQKRIRFIDLTFDFRSRLNIPKLTETGDFNHAQEALYLRGDHRQAA